MVLDESTPFACDNCDWTGTFGEAIWHVKDNVGHTAGEVVDGGGRVEVTQTQEAAQPEP